MSHKVNISDDDLLTILEIRDNIYYGTYKEDMSEYKIKSLCRFSYYIVTDKNYRKKKNIERFATYMNLTYDSVIKFLKMYNIEVK